MTVDAQPSGAGAQVEATPGRCTWSVRELVEPRDQHFLSTQKTVLPVWTGSSRIQSKDRIVNPLQVATPHNPRRDRRLAKRMMMGCSSMVAHHLNITHLEFWFFFSLSFSSIYIKYELGFSGQVTHVWLDGIGFSSGNKEIGRGKIIPSIFHLNFTLKLY